MFALRVGCQSARSEALAEGTLRVKFRHWRLHVGYRLHVCFAVCPALGEK